MTNNYSYSKRVDRDAFLTPRDTADKIVEYLLKQYPDWKDMEWFEPSAGAGVFLDAARSQGITARAVDIHPMRDDIEHGDFLKEHIDLTGHIVFGNPPYGQKISLTIKFINRAFELGAHKVAFLVGGGIVGSQNVSLVVFSGETNSSDWSELYTSPYIESVYIKDIIDTDYIFQMRSLGLLKNSNRYLKVLANMFNQSGESGTTL